ncbi:MAG: thiamine phosphate synthase [Planctomycetota bacterium]|nr:MAG: thiamine phosphate synthase [Planctomycetota bacterium]
MIDVLYRIIDANFNRGREALRVMEEYCRFGLNHPALSAQAKQCRHQLCQSMKGVDPQKLLSNRDVGGDVGRELRVTGQLQRQSLEDCFTAAAKRASEALRALAESIQTIDPAISAAMEKIRFEVYALEKKCVLYACSKHQLESVRLYVLINATAQTDEHKVLDLAKTCIDNGADCLQLRAKEFCDSSLLDLARKFTALCKEAGAVSIINDRADIAILSDADGVHLGQNEIGVSCVRQLAKRPLIIGVSTHTLDELSAAIDSGCDYVGIGPAFASPTKPKLNLAGIGYIRQALAVLEQTGIFHVAIGGIHSQNIPVLLDIGVRAVAVSSALTHSGNPAESCNTLKNTLLNSEQ